MDEWQQLVAEYRSLFVHRWDRYAVQQRDGSYRLVCEPMTDALVAAHLAGRVTLGTYLLDAQSTCQFAVFDADADHGLGLLVQLAHELFLEGTPTILEASRRGGHLWIHLAQPTPAHVVRAWLLPYALRYGVELYPKQDVLLPGGCGSLIRVPLGVHRRARGWFPFLRVSDGMLVPVGQTVEDCCAWVCQVIQRVTVPIAIQEQLMTTLANEPMVTVPVGNDGALVCTQEQAGRGAIATWSRSSDITEVIGRYVALDQHGLGSCPFKGHHYRGDRRPSFQVFGGSDPHWYCYTWGRAGDLFDFLCLYQGLTPQEGWQRLKDGCLLI